MKKKLIEVALPLEAINIEAAREKSIRHGHPSTLHLWWARRPLAACRAVLFASLVDDPSSHPEQFPTEEDQEKERQRLFRLIERLVKWENIGDDVLYKEAYDEIFKSTDGNPPPVLDPFAGGGSIPLEAQRLGLESHASDLNPVAVLINKALIEIPPCFKEMPPINPDSRAQLGSDQTMKDATGLASDVRYYGEWMKKKAFERVGHLYPKAKLPDGNEATIIAWIWARTVKCPNPACGTEMPLVSSYWLSKKKGKEAWIEPIIDFKNKTINFEVKTGEGEPPTPPKVGRGASFRCECCGQVANDKYIKNESLAGHVSKKLMSIVVEGKRGRVYLAPDAQQEELANSAMPKWKPEQEMNRETTNLVSGRGYGFYNWSDLFTSRQLTALATFSDLVEEAISKARADAVAAGLSDDNAGLSVGGKSAKAYSEAVGVYLALGVSRMTDINNSLCRWSVSHTQTVGMFSRQAIAMLWDFAENNVFNHAAGDFITSINSICKVLDRLPTCRNGIASQKDAALLEEDSIVISTDPPYYDNINYADLSDFFYVWLRRTLKPIYSQLFSTMLVPKSEELVASEWRFKNKSEAKKYFENGMLQAFKQMRKSTSANYPLTVYYAYKQSETDETEGNMQTVSSGWETMLQATINAGFSITGTWPLRTERTVRVVAIETNALASSIALVCRPRPDDAPFTTRRAFLTELREALKVGLHNLQSGNIAPVDLAQASIGPGMAVYSKYKEILEADGTPMSVRNALVLINQELDAYLSEQESSMDTDSRFCIAWFEQFGLSTGEYGRAETLAKAKMAHMQALVDDGVLESGRGKVRLKKRNELPEKWSADRENTVWTIVQHLCHSLDTDGIPAAAQIVLDVGSSHAENAKALSYRAYIAAERKGWTEEALAYNRLVTAWPEIIEKTDELRNKPAEQLKLNM